jgi:soluble lytic murein transglycosylase
MKNPRKTINILLIVACIILAGYIFYKYFPQVWGDVVYPLEYKDEILAASNEFHIDRNLIAAVIFVESHFNPQAGSSVGAKGLMQLMPSTARGVAKNIGMTNYNDSMIFDPATNIRLGTAYLRSSIDSRGGNIDVALSNYNGGPSVAGRFQIALDRSLLPRETDAYIRKVKSAKDAYDNIYGVDWEGPTKPFTVDIPESFVDRINIKNIFSSIFGD